MCFHVYDVWLSNFLFYLALIAATNIVSCLWCGWKILNITLLHYIMLLFPHQNAPP